MENNLIEKIKEIEALDVVLEDVVNQQEKNELIKIKIDLLEELKSIVENNIGDYSYLMSKQSYRD